MIVVMYLHQHKISEVHTMITTLSSRAFNQDAGRPRSVMKTGPFMAAFLARPAHVLLTISEYQRITGKSTSIVELLAMPSVTEIEFEPPRLRGKFYQPADLS